MELNLPEWAHLVLRWFHIIAGIAWIGSSFFFMWLDSHLETRPDAEEGDKGELWMVHSGGFYQVKKLLLGPGQVPKTLHWFKWEATLTWISGFFLLMVVYYHGGAMVEPESPIGSGAASAIGVGSLVIGWFVYDALWRGLRKEPTIAALVSMALLVAVSWGLSQVLSARAAYMHVGAMLGTMMVLNVWVHILPAQRVMIAATESGARMDPTPGENAKARSVHNNYMTFPVVFVMISNHFPMTYGHVASWGVLMVLFVASAGIRHFMNKPHDGTGWMIGASTLLLIGVIVFSAPSMQGLYTPARTGGREASSSEPGASSARVRIPQRPVFPGSTGKIRITTRFEGTAPTPAAVSMTGECASLLRGPAVADDVLVRAGLLQNVFVWISKGHEGWRPPAAPETPVVLDQRGCMYSPRVAGARVGQPVELVNSDPVLHNVNVRGAFNIAMPTRGQRTRRRFEREETMVRVRCDVHPWMAAFVGVLEHPWFGVSDERGLASIEELPPGRYEVSAWHEVLGRRTGSVTLEPRGDAELTLSFAEAR